MSEQRSTRMPSDDDAVALLEAMVTTEGLSGHEGEIAALLVERMAAWGFDAQVDEVGNAVGHIGEGPRHLVLLGHMDTVPGVVPVRREDNLLFGRGSVDAKGPLATFIIAAARARAQHLRVTVVGAVEEEAATSKGARYVAERFRPDAAVIGEPSAWNRITLGYKGRLLLDYALERPMSHTAGGEQSACEGAVDYWLALRHWAEAYNAGRTSRFETLDPSLRAVDSSSDGLTERVRMSIGLRLPLGFSIEDLLVGLRIHQGQATVRTHGYELAYRADKRNALTGAFLAAIRAEGGTPAFVNKTGTSDMNVVGPVWGCPLLAYGPGDSSMDHTPDEHIDLDEYLRAIRVLTRVIHRFAERPN
ncbi:MAG: [LysW]-lysine hydrolase [Anaerolineae bacterium]